MGDTLDQSAVNAVARLATEASEIKVLELEDGRILAGSGNGQLTKVYDPDSAGWPDPLGVRSLTSVVDYLAENPDELAIDDVVVLVRDPDQVRVVSKVVGVPRDRKRWLYLAASADLADWATLTQAWMSLEEAQIQLRTRCQQTKELDRLIKLLGNITAQALEVSTDDGFTQEVSTKSGVSLANEELEKVPNPIELRPIRTFPEVDQPTSPFLVRLRLREGARAKEAVEVAFKETDGGAWRQAARDRIKDWLEVQFAHRVGEVKILG